MLLFILKNNQIILKIIDLTIKFIYSIVKLINFTSKIIFYSIYNI